MSIATEIQRLQTAKSNLKTGLNDILPQEHQITTETLDDYADFLQYIDTGGGGYSVESVDNGDGTQTLVILGEDEATTQNNINTYKYLDLINGITVEDEEYAKAENYLQTVYAKIMGVRNE